VTELFRGNQHIANWKHILFGNYYLEDFWLEESLEMKTLSFNYGWKKSL
jgi:hypothetical protein